MMIGGMSFFAFFAGSLIGVYLFSILFRFAILGRAGTKTMQLWVIVLTGVVAIGISAFFGSRTVGFVDQIFNPPTMNHIVAYALSALVVAFFASRRSDEPAPVAAPTMKGRIGRGIALIFVVPMVLIGVGNIVGNAYNIAVNGLPSPGLGVTRVEMRQIMLNGEMAPFWAMIDEKVPEDMDFIIDRIFAAEDSYRDGDDLMAKLNSELLDYRISLAVYGPALTDTQRQTLIRRQADFIRDFQNDPATCVVVAEQGAIGLTQRQLAEVLPAFNRGATEMAGMLIDARKMATDGATMPAAPTEADYTLLINSIYEQGFTEDQLMAFFNGNSEHPGFCDMTIGYMDAVAGFGGLAGERIRFEATQLLLTAASR